ncbi:hypothetical protein A2U01_0094406, partial [Trifolium medium]|nr:hypothetical protein [Trifolium medium]
MDDDKQKCCQHVEEDSNQPPCGAQLLSGDFVLLSHG